MAILAGSIGIGYLISPNLGRSIVAVLLKILIRVAVMTLYAVRLLTLPIALLVGMAVSLVSTITGKPLPMGTAQPPNTPRPVSELKPINLLSYLTNALLLVPVIEEVIFRRVILVELKRFWPRTNKQDAVAKNDVPRIFGYTPWVLISSILFAASHIYNHFHDLPTRLQSTLESRERITIGLVLRAYAQCLVTGYLSLQVFSPVFEAHGLAASIGAHIWWNINTISAYVTVPVRLVQRQRQLRRNKLQQEGGADDKP
jgi:membrane protease YdiL (CAAX protease family)